MTPHKPQVGDIWMWAPPNEKPVTVLLTAKITEDIFWGIGLEAGWRSKWGFGPVYASGWRFLA